jgi:hypothetical protein
MNQLQPIKTKEEILRTTHKNPPTIVPGDVVDMDIFLLDYIHFIE